MDSVLKSVQPDSAKTSKFGLMIAIGLIAHLTLVWAWPYPPLVDWPNHMARHYLEARALAGDPLPSGYKIRYSLVPNLGADLVVPVLLQVLPLTVASRIFLSFTVLTCWLGFGLFVRRQAAGTGYGYAASMLVLPWLLTQSFLMGFLNYASGVGLAFLTFCNYLRLFEKNRAPLIQLFIHGGLVALLYIWHLAALGVYLVLHASHLLMQLLQSGSSPLCAQGVRRKTFFGFATLTPVIALIVAQKLMATPIAIQGAVFWHDPTKKLRVALATILSYNYVIDVVVITLWLAACVAMVRIEALRRFQLDWLTVATSSFLILFLGLPDTIGTTTNVETRVLVPLLICVIGLIVRLPPRRLVVGATLALTATLIRLGGIAASWETFWKIDAQHLAFIQKLPVGARILGLQLSYAVRVKNDVHVIAWAVPERQALVSSLFSIPGQQPLLVDVNKLGPFMSNSPEGLAIDSERIRSAYFDYVWIFNTSNVMPPVPTTWKRVYALSSITMWQVK